MCVSDQSFLHDSIRPPGSELKLGKLLGRVGGNLGVSVERIRVLSGKVEWSPYGSRALWKERLLFPVLLFGETDRESLGDYNPRRCQS